MTRRLPSFVLASRPTRSQWRTVERETRASSATSSIRKNRGRVSLVMAAIIRPPVLLENPKKSDAVSNPTPLAD
jgi:hypothetical protein